jgi:uncharacterized membrane protein YhaH (DUF805 family)
MADGTAWYYAAGGSQKGPVTVEQLEALVGAGVVGNDTLVWRQGMAEWTTLARTELASRFRREPPAPPPMPPQAPPRPAEPPAAVERTRPEPAAAGWGARTSPGPGPGYVPALAPMGMGAAIAACFSKYATFSGRARRAEFWYFFLFLFVIHAVLSIVAHGALTSPGDMEAYRGVMGLEGLIGLVLLLPMIAVTVRRLHDTDRSGWWWWIQIVPLIGVILLIVFAAERGTPGDNRYGPPPT